MTKFRTKTEYKVGWNYNLSTGEKSKTGYKYLDLTITSISEEHCSKLWDNCIDFLTDNYFKSFEIIGCPTIDKTTNNKYCYFDSIAVYDKEEYNELKELIQQWKKAVA